MITYTDRTDHILILFINEMLLWFLADDFDSINTCRPNASDMGSSGRSKVVLSYYEWKLLSISIVRI